MDTTSILGFLGLMIGALVTGLFTWATAKVGRTSSADQFMANLMEQLKQEQLKMGRLERRMDGLVSRERIRDDYILELRQHIAEGKPPPPPDWPPNLIQWEDSEPA